MPKVKAAKMWAVTDPENQRPVVVRRTKRGAVKRWLRFWEPNEPAGLWRYWHRREWRVIPVLVTPAPKRRKK